MKSATLRTPTFLESTMIKIHINSQRLIHLEHCKDLDFLQEKENLLREHLFPNLILDRIEMGGGKRHS